MHAVVVEYKVYEKMEQNYNVPSTMRQLIERNSTNASRLRGFHLGRGGNLGFGQSQIVDSFLMNQSINFGLERLAVLSIPGFQGQGPTFSHQIFGRSGSTHKIIHHFQLRFYIQIRRPVSCRSIMTGLLNRGQEGSKIGQIVVVIIIVVHVGNGNVGEIQLGNGPRNIVGFPGARGGLDSFQRFGLMPRLIRFVGTTRGCKGLLFAVAVAIAIRRVAARVAAALAARVAAALAAQVTGGLPQEAARRRLDWQPPSYRWRATDHQTGHSRR